MQFGQHIFSSDVILIITSQIDDNALVDQLEQIAVAGNYFDAQTLPGSPVRGRTEHIIRFKPFHFQARDIERIHNLADALNLQAQIIRHLGAGGFIFRVNFISKSFPGVEGNRQIIRFFLFEDAQQFTDKAVCSGRRFASGSLPTCTGSACRQRKIHAVSQGVAID